MNLSEDLIPKIFADVYRKKVMLYSVDGTVVNFKCATINEFVELIEKCRQLLKTDNVVCR